MKKYYTGNISSSAGWLKLFVAIGWVAKLLFALCLVVVCFTIKAFASFMKSK